MTAMHGTESPRPQSRCSTFQRPSDSKNTSATKLRSKKTMVIQNCSLMFSALQSVPGRPTSSLSIRSVLVSDALFWISIGGCPDRRIESSMSGLRPRLSVLYEVSLGVRFGSSTSGLRVRISKLLASSRPVLNVMDCSRLWRVSMSPLFEFLREF